MTNSTETIRALDQLSHWIIACTRFQLAIAAAAIAVAAWGLTTDTYLPWWIGLLALGCWGLATDGRRLAYERGRLDERMLLCVWDAEEATLWDIEGD